MSRLVVRVVEESYDSHVCVFEHSRDDDSVIIRNDPATIAESIEELDAAAAYLKSIRDSAPNNGVNSDAQKAA